MTRPIHRILCLLALVVAASMPGQAQAQAFMFNVPLDLKSIHPKYTVVMVTCRVDGQQTFVGVGTTRVNLTAGGFNGVVSVPVDPGPGKSLLDARTYTCEASYCTSQADVGCTPAFRQGSPETMAQPGALFTPRVSGSIR